MTNHTADDFAKAEFARHIDGRRAMRIGGDRGAFRWWVGKYGADSDEGMADGGWEPVVTGGDEKDELIHLLRGTVRDIRDKATTLLCANKALREDVAAAKGAGVSLDALHAAWENAEVPTEDAPTREGDVVIVRNDSGIGGYFVRPSHETHDFELEAEGSVRILSRAPQSDPWQDLADVLAVEMPGIEDEPRIEALAKALYCEHDVRVTGGGDQ